MNAIQKLIFSNVENEIHMLREGIKKRIAEITNADDSEINSEIEDLRSDLTELYDIEREVLHVIADNEEPDELKAEMKRMKKENGYDDGLREVVYCMVIRQLGYILD